MNHTEAEIVVSRYYGNLNSGNLENLLGMFADDATFEDPVMEGILQGHQEIGNFFRSLGGMFRRMHIDPVRIFPDAGGCAVAWNADAETQSGDRLAIQGVNVMEFKGDKIESIRVFFDPSALVNGRQGDKNE